LASYGHRRSLRPLSLFGALSCVAYAWWFLAQDSWALKTKYILFLLPAYVLFALLGLRRLLAQRGWSSRLVAGAVLGLLCLLLSTSLAYLTCFALA
jgi:membrane-associated phospholipid phosphatase